MNRETFTVLGAEGLIGSALVSFLRTKGHSVNAPSRHTTKEALIESLIGHVIYCIGVTSDFIERPWDCFDAHVFLLREVLHTRRFSSFTYLSSTRVYYGSGTGDEDTPLIVSPASYNDLYNVSKITGETLCHLSQTQDVPVRVARVSNVISFEHRAPAFINSLVKSARNHGSINLNSSLASAKDYVMIDDVLRLLELISTKGRRSVYNVGSGHLISNDDIVTLIQKETDAQISVDVNAPSIVFPALDISRIKSEFNYKPENPLVPLQDALSKWT